MKIGYLVLVILIGCGQGRDLKGEGFGKGPPVRIGEVSGVSSLGPTVLTLYTGSVEPSRVLGRVGMLDEVIDFTEVVSSSGASPFEQVSEEVIQKNSPVYLVSSSAVRNELAAFVDTEVLGRLKRPLIYSKPIQITPVIRYCSQFHFKGNDFLNNPQKCDGVIYCVVPPPSDFECRLDSEGQTECQPWMKWGGFGQPVPSSYTQAGFQVTQEETRAFECNHWKNETAFSYHLEESKKLTRLRMRFEPNVKIKVEVPTGHLDSGGVEPKWIQFAEETLDFNWGK